MSTLVRQIFARPHRIEKYKQRKVIEKVVMRIIVTMWHDWKEYLFVEDVTFRY